MAHLAAGAGFFFSVKMQGGVWLADDIAPRFYVIANEVFHDGI